MRVLGMISGTSFDAVDVAVADLSLEGETIVLRPRGTHSVPYPADLRAALAAAMPPRTITAETVCMLDTRIGQLFADAAVEALAQLDLDVDLIASHGQTLYHWVTGRQAAGTLQIGQPAWIAERTGVAVVADLRARDLAAGGHGAPLASTLDVLLLGGDAAEPRAALNLGGIANLTVLGTGRSPLAYDVGPANALIDAAVEAATGGDATYDHDGQLAASGTIDVDLLQRLLDEPYYDLAPPKSTGKEHFNLAYLEDRLAGRAIDADVVATVTALTAEVIAQDCRRFGLSELVVSGGGTSNPVLMKLLHERLGGDVSMRPIDDLGIPSDSKEAYLLALLGFLTVHDLPGTFPGCTGAAHPSILGAVVPGATGLPRPTERVDGPPTRLRVEVPT